MNKKNYLILFRYVLDSYLRAFIFIVPSVLVIFLILKITDIYSMLDLKYDSVLISGPIIISLFLAGIVLIFGSILYGFKYRRKSPKTSFYRSLEGVFEEKNKK